MTGHRRSRAESEGRSVSPRVSETRSTRIQQRMKTRYAEAMTGSQRLAVMCDYVRAAAAASTRIDPVRTEDTLADLVIRLNRAGDALLQTGGPR